MIRWVYWKIRGVLNREFKIIRVGSSGHCWATRDIWDGGGFEVLDEFKIWPCRDTLSDKFANIPIIPKGKAGTFKVNRLIGRPVKRV